MYVNKICMAISWPTLGKENKSDKSRFRLILILLKWAGSLWKHICPFILQYDDNDGYSPH